MRRIRFLIDTNIVIGLEDAGEIKKVFADFVRKANEHGITLYVHEASKHDIRNDKNDARRKATLSKIQKFSVLEKVAVPNVTALATRFGNLRKPNDVVDATLLHAVDTNLVDILVSQDDGLYRRAKSAGIESNVLTVGDALAWIKLSYEPAHIALPAVVSILAYELDESDPIFLSLEADYKGFNAWLRKCKSEHRECWVIRDANKALSAIVIRKDETHTEAETEHSGPKILKLSTFKVSDAFGGNKYGELLLKQTLWHAQKNAYDLVYVTAFPKQQKLIELFEDYGFRQTKTKSNGEIVLEKPIGKGQVKIPSGKSALEVCRDHYPRFADGPGIRKFIIPIRPPYHRKLFPEIDPGGISDKPGNTIRKVYLCRASNNDLRSGDVLIFYKSKGPGPGSQALTSIAVVEQVRKSRNLRQVMTWTAKRSVFSASELSSLVRQRPTPLKVIDFLLVGHIEPVVSLAQLVKKSIFVSWSQSITTLTERKYAKLKPLLKIGFSF